MWHRDAYMEYDVFSANPSISPTWLKPSDVANGVGQGEWGRTAGNGVEPREQGGTGGEQGGIGGNGVGLGGTGWGWGGRIGV